jgi:hypothetical protein
MPFSLPFHQTSSGHLKHLQTLLPGAYNEAQTERRALTVLLAAFKQTCRSGSENVRALKNGRVLSKPQGLKCGFESNTLGLR